MDIFLPLTFLIFIVEKIDVNNAQQCGGDLRAAQGMIFSPTYRTKRRYSNNLYCVWKLHFTKYDMITLWFRDMQMENGGTCLKDYVKIALADKPERKVCGFQVPRTRFNGVGPANVTFVSDRERVFRGFGIQYSVRGTPCKSLPCQNGGTCENVPPPGEGYKCICPENFSGNDCEIVLEVEAPKYCESEPCQNGGTCNEVDSGYECQCDGGWEGTNCEADVDECASNPCQNGGTCENLSNEYRCQCAAGWSGDNCEEDVDECASSPCQNGGTCENLNNEYRCQCPEGWGGVNCDEDADECASNPCQNGATCEDLTNEYRCQCAAGWSGTNCDEDIDECESNPCKNQATCENLVNEYRCKCVGGWAGTNCEEDIDECASNPCRNGGTCENLFNKFKCQCKKGWTGIDCSEDADDCIPNPCKNGGRCRDAFNDFQCTCKDPWTGKTCEEKVEVIEEEEEEAVVVEEKKEGSNVCIPNPCQNQGTCVKWGDSFTCTCGPGWEGDDCSENIDECKSDPCAGDLVCVDLINSYKCREQCDPGYTGEECDVEINECDSEPCENGATCEDGLNTFSCKCEIGFSGVLCDVENPCEGQPCKNGGTCQKSSSGGNNSTGFMCTCQLGWMGTTCEEVVEKGCENPDGPDGGIVPYGVSLEFFCDEGFELSGPGSVTCLDNGKFDHAIPECLAKDGFATVVNMSASALKSPMVLSMLIAGGLIVVAIIAVLLYLFVFAPWNTSVVAASPDEC